jgi:hypothetical protein
MHFMDFRSLMPLSAFGSLGNFIHFGNLRGLGSMIHFRRFYLHALSDGRNGWRCRDCCSRWCGWYGWYGRSGWSCVCECGTPCQEQCNYKFCGICFVQHDLLLKLDIQKRTQTDSVTCSNNSFALTCVCIIHTGFIIRGKFAHVNCFLCYACFMKSKIHQRYKRQYGQSKHSCT